jgi:hypothetical protein
VYPDASAISDANRGAAGGAKLRKLRWISYVLKQLSPAALAYVLKTLKLVLIALFPFSSKKRDASPVRLDQIASSRLSLSSLCPPSAPLRQSAVFK